MQQWCPNTPQGHDVGVAKYTIGIEHMQQWCSNTPQGDDVGVAKYTNTCSNGALIHLKGMMWVWPNIPTHAAMVP